MTAAPTNDETKAFLTVMEKWETANDIVAGLILGSLSTSVKLIVNLGNHVHMMYSKLEAHVLKKSSRTSTLTVQAEIVEKRLKQSQQWTTSKHTSISFV